MRRNYRRLLLGSALSASLAAAVLSPAVADTAPAVQLSDDPVALGEALASDTSWVTGAALETHGGASATALVSGDVASMPTSGQHATLLSTGDAELTTMADSSGSSGANLGGSTYRGDSDYDVP